MQSRRWHRAVILGTVAAFALVAAGGFGLLELRSAQERSDRAEQIRAFGVGACVDYPIASYIDVSAPEFARARSVPCSQPHVFEILAVGSLQSALDACNGKYEMTTSDRYVNILDTDTLDLTDNFSICEGSNAITGPGKRVVGSFRDHTAAPAEP